MVTLIVYQTVVNSFTSAEFVIFKNIIIHGEIPAVQIQLIEIMKIYPRLWENDNSTVRVPPEKWMTIQNKNN